MKKKKVLLVFVLCFALVIGWIATIKKVSGIDIINEQKELVCKADEFLEKKLFIRGIPILEQALAYDTRNNADIERKLLDAYWNYGNVEAYYSLLQNMERKYPEGVVLVQDYLRLAEFFYNVGNEKDALGIVIEGKEKHEDKKLDSMYQKLRYAYMVKELDCVEVVDTKDAKLMPGYDGEKWNYFNKNGQVSLVVNAQETFPFNEQYAVVKVDNRYCSIVKNGDLYGIDETGVDKVLGITDKYIIAKKDDICGYYNFDFKCVSQSFLFEDITLNNNGVATVKKNGKWAIISDEGELLTEYIYDDVAVNSLGQVFAGGRGMVKEDGKWVMVDVSGNPLCSQVFYDAKAPESGEFIAVGNEKGMWGFIDRNGELVIDYQYYDAKSFNCEMAPVMVANYWGYISPNNILVINDIYESANPFHEGSAIVKLDTKPYVVEQKYYESVNE